MLKNKIIVKKIRNIMILLMALIIMMGAYTNIRKSKAENVLEIYANVIDNYGYLASEEIELGVKQISDDLFEIELPETVNGKKINRIEKISLESIEPEIASENAVKINAMTENTEEIVEVDTTTENVEETVEANTITENVELTQNSESTEQLIQEENIESEQEEEHNIESEQHIEIEQDGTTNESFENNDSEKAETLEIVDNKIYLTKEQIENKVLNIEVEYDILVVTRNEVGEIQKEALLEKTEEQRNELGITEETELLYNKILKYEDEENGKLVELKGYLPKDAEIQVELVTQEKLTEIFGEAKIDVAYDIKIVRYETKEIYIDENDITKGTKEEIEIIEIEPESFGETCEVSITDSNIKTNSNVYHVDDDNNIEKINVTNNEDKSISFEAEKFSIYAVSDDSGISTFGLTSPNYSVSVSGNNTSEVTVSIDWKNMDTSYAITGYAWTKSSTQPSSFTNVSYVGTSAQYTQSSAGTWYIHVRNANGYAGYEGPYTVTDPHYDPTVSVSGGGSWTNASSVVVTVTGTNYTSLQWKYSTSSTWNTVNNNKVTFSNEQNSTAQFRAYCSTCGKYSSIKTTEIKIDRTVPTISAEANSTWKQEHSITVTLSDDASGLASGNSIRYGWSTSNTTAPSSYKTATLSYSSGVKSTTFTATGSGYTGSYYLWVEPTTYKDVAGNSNTTTFVSSNQYKFDNTNPTIREDVYKTGLIRKFDGYNNTGDGHSNSATVWNDLKGNNDGTLNGGFFWDDYISLDGVDDWVNLGQVSVTDAITLETTIELNEVQPERVTILGNQQSGGFLLQLETGGLPRMGVYNVESSSYVYTPTTGVEALVAGRKYHIVGVFDGTSVKLYVDGECVAENNEFSGTTRLPTNNTVMAIGCDPNGSAGNGQFANIKVYTARIYSNALSATNVGRNLVVEQRKNWSKSHTVPIRIGDSHSGLGTGTSIKYAWSTSPTTEPSSFTEATIGSYTAGDSVKEFEITKSGLSTGRYYLWLKLEPLKDAAGNSITTTMVSDLPCYFDSTNPNLGITDVVQDGLRANYDAYNNTGSGHSDSTTKWTDLAGNNDGKLHEGTFGADYLQLDGVNDWVNVGPIKVGEAITLEATIMMDSINTAASSVIIGNLQYGGVWVYVNKDGYVRMEVWDADLNDWVATPTEINTQIITGQKYHIVGVFDGATIKIYVDGVLQAETNYTGTYGAPGNDTVMAIGGDPDGSSAYDNFSNMKIYSARIYDKALTDEEVDTNYKSLTKATKWARSHNVIVSLSDVHSGLNTGASVKYGWSLDTTNEPEIYDTPSLSYSLESDSVKFPEGLNRTIFTATGSGITGKYYLWKVAETLDDIGGNSNTSTVKSLQTYWFDNKRPVWSTSNINIDSSKSVITANIIGTDEHSGIGTSTLDASKIKVYVDGEEANIAKKLETVTTESHKVTYKLTLSNFEEAIKQSGKGYIEWSGNVTIEIPEDTLIDVVGNTSIEKVFTLGDTDFIKPRMEYQYYETDINKTNKKVKLVFSVIDKFLSTSSLTADDLTVFVDGELPGDTNGNGVIDSGETLAITKTLTNKTIDTEVVDENTGLTYKTDGSIWADVNGTSKQIGERYELVISDLEKTTIGSGEKYANYSGIITVAMPANKFIDSSNNGNKAEIITVGVNINEEYPYIPEGYSQVTGTTLENGLVIRDSSGNEFVWVEVPQTIEVYQTAGLNITEFTEEEYSKIEIDLNTYTSHYKRTTTSVDDWISVDKNNLPENEYNNLKKKVLKSIYNNGGFYVGRYETGTTTERTESTDGLDGLQNPVIQPNVYTYNYVTKYQALNLAQRFSLEGYTSSLLFNVQWDLIMKYLENKGVAYEELVVDSTSWGNYRVSEFDITNTNAKYRKNNVWYNITESYTKNSSDVVLLTTGATDVLSKQNIYDLAGNVYEVVHSVTSVGDKIVGRGGWWLQESGGDAMAANLHVLTSSETSNRSFGFRVALVKDEEPDGVVVDVVDPVWTVSGSLDGSGGAITLQGTDKYFKESTLTEEDIEIWVNNVKSTEATVTLGTATILKEDIDGDGTAEHQYGVEYPIIIEFASGNEYTDFTDNTHTPEVKSKYKESIGKVELKIPAGKLIDEYGNTSKAMDKVFGNFDAEKPEVIYKYSETTVDPINNTITVVFDITDKFFNSSSLEASDITAKIGSTTITDKELTSVNLTTEVDGTNRRVGNRFTLVLSPGEQTGIVTIDIPAGKASDLSGKTNNAQTITIGKDLPENTGSAETVDLINPTVTANPNKTTNPISAARDFVKSQSIAIIPADDYSGLHSDNSYLYYLSTSDTGLSGGSWTDAPTIGTGLTGTYYLFVKTIADKDGNISTLYGDLENIDGIIYHRFGPYKFDNQNPTITVDNQSCTWRNSALNIKITHNDTGGAGVASTAGEYFLSTSLEPTSVPETESLKGTYESGNEISINPEMSGQYYLFVKQISDNATNTSNTENFVKIKNENDEEITYHRIGGVYQFDYDKPEWNYYSKDIYLTNSNDVGNDEYANADRKVKVVFKGTDVTSNVTSTLTSDNIVVLVNETQVANSNKTLVTENNGTQEVTCTLTITGIQGDGELNVVIPSGTLTDQATNKNVLTDLTTIVNVDIDNDPPDIDIEALRPITEKEYYKAGQVITIKATYNDANIGAGIFKDEASTIPITVDNAPTMTLAFGNTPAKGAAACTNVNGNELTYTYTIQGADNAAGDNGDNGILKISGLDAVYDAAGNILETPTYPVTPMPQITADTILPTVKIKANKTSWTNAEIITYTFEFSENVIGFTKECITIINGTPVGEIGGSDATYTLEVEKKDESVYTQTVSVEADKCVDIAGNGNIASNTVSIDVDRVKPTITVEPDKTTNALANDYQKSQNVKITANDVGAGLLPIPSNSYEYYLSNSSTSLSGEIEDDYDHEDSPERIPETLGTGLTGEYYLFVKTVKDNVTDSVKNESTTAGDITKISGYHMFGTYKFDNTKPYWEIGTPSIDYTNKKVTVDIIGTDDHSGYKTNTLDIGDIEVWVDSTKITNVTKALSTATTVTGGIKYTLTLTNFEEAVRQTDPAKPFKEWSGSTKIVIAADTLEDNLGNKNESDDYSLGHIDIISPEFTYKFANTTIGNGPTGDKKVTVVFDVVDKYFADASLTASNITVSVSGYTDEVVQNAIDKQLTLKTIASDVTDATTGVIYKTDGSIYYTVSGTSVKIGERYELVISELEQKTDGYSDGFDISGYMTLTFPAGTATVDGGGNKTLTSGIIDTSGNLNPATTITIGIDENDGNVGQDVAGNGAIVDVVDPVWELNTAGSNIPAGIIKIRAKDKYLNVANLPDSTAELADLASKITVYVGGQTTSLIGKTVTGPTTIQANQEYEYTITLELSDITIAGAETVKFKPTNAVADSLKVDAQGYAYYRKENGGSIGIGIASGTITDTSGNINQERTFLNIGNIDETKPEIFDVEKIQNSTANTLTITFNVTDRNYDSSNLITTSEITTWVDGVQTTDIEISSLTSKEIWGKIDINGDGVCDENDPGDPVILGHQYTLALSKIAETEAQFSLSGRRYKELSGTIEIKIAATAANDTDGNYLNTTTTTISDFVDYIAPEIRYTHRSTDINAGSKSYTMTFTVIDKYYTSGTITTQDIADGKVKIYMQNGQLDASGNQIIYDLKAEADAGLITIGLTSTEIMVDNMNVTNTSGIIQADVDNYLIGHEYTLTISGLDQLEIKSGLTTADYSGVITLEIAEDEVVDRTYNGTNNGNAETIITSGVNFPGGTGTGTPVDVVAPLWNKISSSSYAFNPTDKTKSIATITVQGTDTYFWGVEDTSIWLTEQIQEYEDARTLTTDEIEVYVDGTLSSIIPTITTEWLYEDRYGENNVQYGIKNTITITEWPQDANQVKIKIVGDAIKDKYGNGNKATEFILYNCLKITVSEFGETKGFLGGNIERQHIENITFLSNTSNVPPTGWWDVSAIGDNSIKAWAQQLETGNYKVNIASDSEIFANQNSKYLFSYIGCGSNCKEEETIAYINLLNTSSVTNMSNMFYQTGYTAMTSMTLPTTFDTSNVNDMTYMFCQTGYTAMASLTLPTSFNTINVTDMSYMFARTGYTAMTSLTLPTSLDTTNVKNMKGMFTRTGYTAMTTLILPISFNTENVIDMSYMFQFCGELNMTNLVLPTSFDTSKVTNMSYMFLHCGSRNMINLELPTSFDTSRVTNMSYMFKNCGYTKMTNLTLPTSFDTSKVTDMSYMFENTGYTVMTSLNLGNKFDTSSVTNMCGMFKGCGYMAMTSLDLGNLFYTTDVTDMTEMFKGCGKSLMTTLDLGPAFTKIASTNTEMFTNCGTTGIIIYAPESIYKNRTSFKLNKLGQ